MNSTLRRTLSLSLAAALTAVVGIGCFDDITDPNDDDIDITVDAISDLTAGGNVSVTGDIESDPALESITIVVQKGGVTVTDRSVTATFNTPVGLTEADFSDDMMNLTLDATPAACNGTYTLKISASAGTAENITKTQAFTVTGGVDCDATTPVTSTTVTLGAAASSSGSSLDADLMEVYTTTGTSGIRGSATLQATIDVWFAVTSSNEAKIYSPSLADDNGWGPELTGTWLNAPSTSFIKLSGVTFADIETQEEIDALWSGTAQSSLEIADGDVVIVETTAGAYVLLSIQSILTPISTSSTVQIKGTIEQ